MYAPAPVDLGASDALLAGTQAVAALAKIVAEDPDPLSWPADGSTPSLAGWIARRHLVMLAGHWDGQRVIQWYADVQQAAARVKAAAGRGHAEVYVPKPCGKPLFELDARGRPRSAGTCPGVVVVREGPHGTRAECSSDAGHWVAFETWLRALRATRTGRRGARPKSGSKTSSAQLFGNDGATFQQRP